MNLIASERIHSHEAVGAMLARSAALGEHINAPHFIFDYVCTGPIESERAAYVEMQERIRVSRNAQEIIVLQRELLRVPTEIKWRDGYKNTVVTVGKNHILDTEFAGSSYTAAWYLGLISSSSYSAIAAGDTMSSHSGWTESTAYSNSTRGSLSWSSASAGSKATSSAVSFTANATDTVKGGFVTTVSTKSGTTGTLYSAGLFTGGDQPIVSGNSLSVSVTMSV